jgi:hypothetical protein
MDLGVFVFLHNRDIIAMLASEDWRCNNKPCISIWCRKSWGKEVGRQVGWPELDGTHA